ncbi:MAG: D-alanyl-D-alanine carboxypeptidase [Alphaproteobacteria bacterium]|nr:D-alanyl-D-alanine carboxypeptidase [Alphaproteobacteria bacterium]
MSSEGLSLARFCAVSLAAFLALASPSAAAPPPSFVNDDRYSSIVVDADSGRVIAAVNADQILHPASLTKIMTLYMAFDALKRNQLSLGQPLPVSSRAASMTPSKLGLRPGDTLTTEQAILGLVTKSANDAAAALAEAMGGSESEFAQAMTQRARALGMHHTTFTNASGLPDLRQVTSARDMAMLALAMLRDHPRQYRYFATSEFAFRGQIHRNHNRLLGAYDGVDGIKTGFINASGFNLVASAQRDGQRVIGVVFGGSTSRARDAHMASLLDDGFRSLGIRHMDAPLVRVADQKKPAEKPAKASAGASTNTKGKAKGPSADEIERQAIEAAGGRGWLAQIGVFKTQAQAERAVADAFRMAPRPTATASSDIAQIKTAEGKRFRARLQNLSSTQVKALCEELKRQKQACQPVQAPSAPKATMADASDKRLRVN